MSSQVVVLAGGLGTRLFPLTRAVPKVLVPVAGRPFAEWLFERLGRAGFTDALVCVGHLAEQVEAALGDGARFGLRVRCVADGPVPLGTAGALRAALPLLDPRFLVTYGDALLPFDYTAPLRDLEAHPDALGTMAVYDNHDRFDRSNTAVRGDVVTKYEKPRDGEPRDPTLTHIDYGAMALQRSVIEALPPGGAIGLERVQGELASRGKLRALAVEERFYEIGSAAGIADLEAALARGAA